MCVKSHSVCPSRFLVWVSLNFLLEATRRLFSLLRRVRSALLFLLPFYFCNGPCRARTSRELHAQKSALFPPPLPAGIRIATGEARRNNEEGDVTLKIYCRTQDTLFETLSVSVSVLIFLLRSFPCLSFFAFLPLLLIIRSSSRIMYDVLYV